MEALTSYHDLCKEIEVLELRAESLEDEVKLLNSKLTIRPITKLVASYSGMPGAGMSHIQTDRIWRRLHDIQMELEEIYDILQLKCDYKMRMESHMQEFEGLEYRVAYERDINRKPLPQIAKELGYSYDWIKRISARVKRYRPSA